MPFSMFHKLGLWSEHIIILIRLTYFSDLLIHSQQNSNHFGSDLEGSDGSAGRSS